MVIQEVFDIEEDRYREFTVDRDDLKMAGILQPEVFEPTPNEFFFMALDYLEEYYGHETDYAKIGTFWTKGTLMKSALMKKKDCQALIKKLRQAGYVVDKISGGYECYLDGDLIFKAMDGRNAYLVRYNTEVIS